MDNSIYCLDLKGNLVWKFITGDWLVSDPELSGERIFFTSGDRNLYCTDLEGRLLWKRPTELLVYITADKQAIYVGGWDCKMHAFSIDGKPLWKFHTSLSYESEFIFEPVDEVSYEVIHQTGQAIREEVDKKSEKVLESYADLKGQYIQGDMRDYIGEPVSEGPGMAYKQARKVYRK
jgi:hypothetical protein